MISTKSESSHLQDITIEQPLKNKTNLPCYIIKNFLTPKECSEFIEKAVKIGFDLASHDYPPSYRNNERIIMDDEELAEKMTKKLKPMLDSLNLVEFEKDGLECELKSVNSRFRLCRYQEGQEFRIHQDGVHYKSKFVKSILTFMIYLNEEFDNGHTIFFKSGPSSNPPEEMGKYKPQCGDLIVFDHELWHSGEIVNNGIKYVMRSDIIYDTIPISFGNNSIGTMESLENSNNWNNSHNGYVWKLIKVGKDDSLIASGGRDTTINIFNESLQIQFKLEGHQKSVLGLSKMANNQMVSISRDRSIKIWDLETRECIFTKEQAHNHTGLCVEADPFDSSIIASGSADCIIKLWKFVDGKLELSKQFKGHNGWIWSLKWITIEGERMLLSASEDGSIRVWNIETGSCHIIDQLQNPLRCLTTFNYPNSQMDTIICLGDNEGNLYLYYVKGGFSNFSTKRTEFKNLHRASIRTVNFISSHMIVTGSEDYSVMLWKLKHDLSSIPQLHHVYTFNHNNFVTDCLSQFHNEQQAQGEDNQFASFFSSSYDGAIKKHQVSLSSTSL